MRRMVVTAVLAACLGASVPAGGATAGFADARRDYETLEPRLRQELQVWLIAAGLQNAVPSQSFSSHTFDALRRFQSENGFVADGRLNITEIKRLAALVDPMFRLWGLQRIALPGHQAAIWVPFGLDLEVRRTDKGFFYKDRLGRFELGFRALPHVSAQAALNDLVAKERALGTTIHYGAAKDGWFALATTKADGTDHYYRYHQDGDFLTGFVMDWDNRLGDIHAERIAVLDSAVLAASMAGEPFVDPPQAEPAVAEAEPPTARSAAVPVAPQPTQPQKKGFSSGSGFFVTSAGHLVTNAHVVKGCSEIMAKTDDGTVSQAVELATDTTNDLALLKIARSPARLAALRIGTRLGEGVEAFGFPHADILASSGNFTLGNVTALSGLGDDGRFLQISAPVQSGNSGGPLLDSAGNLVGVVTSKLNAVKVMLASDDLPQNVNFAVKAGMVAQFLDANRVAYRTGTLGTVPLPPADIADQARAMSAFVVCR